MARRKKMRKRQVISYIKKMKVKIQEGKVVKMSRNLFEDDFGKHLYSLEQNPTCGCLIGLWYLTSGSQNFEDFEKYIKSAIPKKYGPTDGYGSSFSATRVTEAGPAEMLKVLNKALKKLEA